MNNMAAIFHEVGVINVEFLQLYNSTTKNVLK